MAPPSVAGAILGALVADDVSERLLYAAIAAVLVWSGIDLALRPVRRAHARAAAALARRGVRGSGSARSAAPSASSSARCGCPRSCAASAWTSAGGGTNLVVGFLLGVAGFAAHAARSEVEWRSARRARRRASRRLARRAGDRPDRRERRCGSRSARLLVVVGVAFAAQAALREASQAGRLSIAGMATTEDRGSLDATQAWREELYARDAGAAGRALLDDLGARERAARDAGHGRGRLRPRPRLPGRLSVHARRLSVDVPRQALDDAAVRGLRHRRGDERALPLPARPRPDRALDRLRHADADGLRLRPRALARRGRPRGRGDRLARGHGDALPRHPARRGLDLDDDQLAGGDPARVLHRGRRGAGRAGERAARDDPDGHPQGVHRAEGVHLPARAVDAARHGHGRVLRARAAEVAPDLDLRLPHPRGGLDRGAGARVHARGRLHLRRVGGRARPRRRRLRAAALASSSTRTSTSSRRSRSTAPRAGSGRASCATASARATRARG